MSDEPRSRKDGTPIPTREERFDELFRERAAEVYRPVEGKLTWLSLEEAELIAALRADPDQERHIVDIRIDQWQELTITVRHPITERLRADALFVCPVLDDFGAWLDASPGDAMDHDAVVGRYRLSVDGNDFERMQ